MKLELVSFALCPFVHRAAILLAEKKVEHTTRYIDLKAKPDWFLAISPRGKVPLLVADGVVLFESAAIVEFLDETHAPPLVPSDPFERARQRAWVEVASDLFLAQYKLYTAKTEEELATQRATQRAILQRYEEALRGDHFAGDALGLVDVATAPALVRALLLEKWSGVDLFEGTPRVRAWAERLAARPSVKSAVPADFEALYRASVIGAGSALASRFAAWLNADSSLPPQASSRSIGG